MHIFAPYKFCGKFKKGCNMNLGKAAGCIGGQFQCDLHENDEKNSLSG